MSRQPWLSKSRIQSGRQCHKRLWLELHDRNAASWTPAAQARLEEGTRFGDLARALLGGGALVAADHLHADEALAETAALLAQPHTVVPMLFEPAFAHHGVRVRVDAFQRHGDHDTLIEVKSTTSVKPEHVWDCAIQTWVARGAGRNVTRVLHGHVDTRFIYQTEGDYEGLLTLVDITPDVEALVPDIPRIVDELKQVVVAPMPAIGTGDWCSQPYGCPFLAHCRAAEPPGPDFPVALLPRAGALVARFVAAGHVDLRDVPESELQNPMHRRIAAATRTGERFVSDDLPRVLGEIAFPRCHLDFETISFVVPRWLGTRPFQQLPFQFSLHTESHDGLVRHDEFLDMSGESPLQGFVERLLDVLPASGPVIVWNKGFEGARLRELAQHFPHHAEGLLAIIDRMVDLLPVFRRHYYHRDMLGSWSIKAVLPTIAPDLAYNDLEVDGGIAAQSAWLEAVDPGTSPERKSTLHRQLLAYCERDTLAMVRLANWRPDHSTRTDQI